jgi:quinoprotein glucose dehydrogenase
MTVERVARRGVPRAAGLCAAVLMAIVPGATPGAQTPAGEWRHYAGDAGSRKYSPLDRITPANVQRLEVAWRWTSPDNAVVTENPTIRPGSYQDTPIMANGVLYTVTSLGQVAALDAGTGRTIWTYDPGTWKAGRPGNLGFLHRGLAYWTDGKQERLILGTAQAYLISIDARTGALDPAFGDGGRVDLMEGVAHAVRGLSYAVSSAPIVCRGVVVVGASVHDGPTHKEWPRGDVKGFDVRTGRRLWTFRSIPAAGDHGHDTWGDNSADYTGSTNVWSLMSADEELGYVYLPFGTPTNDFYGGHRPGANLFAESLVALDVRSGTRVWHFQAVHHGVWDYDLPAAPVLADIRVDGKSVPAVAQVSKQGFAYVFDRRTGTPIWPIEERPVPQSSVPGERTSPTQPFPTRPPPFERQGLTDDNLIDYTPELRQRAIEALAKYQRGPLFTPPSEAGTAVLPGWVGGANWGGAAFDPDSGVLYVPSVTIPTMMQLVKPDSARSNFLYRRGGMLAMPTIDGLSVVKPPYGRVTAIALNHGDIAWMTPLGDGPRNHPLLKGLDLPPLGVEARGNPLVTRTLLFVAQGAGNVGGTQSGGAEPRKIHAFDKTTGAHLHAIEPPLPGPMASPMTYLYRERQYLVVAVGGGANAELIAFTVGE